MSDGAAAVVMVSPALHARLGHPPGLAFVDAAAGGVDPARLGLGAVPAVERLRARMGGLHNVDAIEFNEAFASQVLATLRALDLPSDITNPHGGAIALGHPMARAARCWSSGCSPGWRATARADWASPMLAAAGGLGVATALAPV